MLIGARRDLGVVDRRVQPDPAGDALQLTLNVGLLFGRRRLLALHLVSQLRQLTLEGHDLLLKLLDLGARVRARAGHELGRALQHILELLDLGRRVGDLRLELLTLRLLSLLELSNAAAK